MALTFANKVTMCRIVAVPFFIASVLYYRPSHEYLRYLALGIFLLAILTDMIDGYIARTRHQKTKAGAILDPLADKLLLMSAFLCLYKMRSLLGSVAFPLWLVLIVLSRDAILLLGSMIIYLVQGKLEIAPTTWGKATAVLQMVCVLGILLQWQCSMVLWWATALFTVISGLGYIRHGIKVLNVHFS